MLFDDRFKTIANPSKGIFKDRGSIFNGFAFPVNSEKEVKTILNQLRREHPKANHHCYAFRLGPDRTIFRFSDDREPSGSAGKPILNRILASDLTDILVVVVRYFGGSLLGVTGLIHAYKNAAADAISQAIVIEKYLVERYRVTFGFELMNEVMGILKLNHAEVIEREMGEEAVIDFEIRKKDADTLLIRLKSIYKGVKSPEIVLLPPII